jgi:hypothetical protein
LDREGVAEGEGIPREAVGERDEALHAKEIYVRRWDDRRICLVELIDANRKKPMTGNGWQSVGRTLIRETHHCTFIAAVSTPWPASVPIIPTTFNTVALVRRHHLRDAVQAVVAIKVRLRVARRYTHTVHLRRDAEQGGT